MWNSQGLIDFIQCICHFAGLRHHLEYKQLDEKHAFFTLMSYKWSIIPCAVVFMMAALVPISYIIFDHPQPANWILPIQTQ